MVAQDPVSCQALSGKSVKSRETHQHAGEPFGVERNRTRAGVPTPVLHSTGESASQLAESHETHVGVASLGESHNETSPSENPKGGTPVHITTRP
jgi:hypothetical protein